MLKCFFYKIRLATLADQNRTEQYVKRRAGKICICNQSRQ